MVSYRVVIASVITFQYVRRTLERSHGSQPLSTFRELFDLVSEHSCVLLSQNDLVEIRYTQIQAYPNKRGNAKESGSHSDLHDPRFGPQSFDGKIIRRSPRW